MTHPTGNPRADAALVLTAAMSGRERSTDLLDRFQRAYPAEAGRDAGLLHELVLGVLRRRLALAVVMSRFASRPLDRIDPVVREILLTSAYQALFLTRIPAHARVSAAVDAARMLAGEGAGRFVNAVCRALEREAGGSDLLTGLDAATRFSVPHPVLRRIEAVLGHPASEAELAPLAERASISVRIHQKTRENAIRELAEAGIVAKQGTWAPECVILDNGRPLADLDWVPCRMVPQDEASQLVAEAVQARPGERIVDLCAGVGIKTSRLLASGASVIAVDRDRGRLDRCRDLCRRMDLPVPDTMVVDARSLPDSLAGTADAVLVDAPCTGIGTLVRRPEVRYLRREGDFDRAAALEAAILQAGLRLLRPGGRLVYAVCSFAQEEGPVVVEAVLSSVTGLTLEPLGSGRPFDCPDGTLRTLPWRDGMDGFFVARIRKS